jgi:PiT family inorganic phosphate transporter
LIPAALSPLIGGIYLGWALGANDAGNVFGTAVGARVLRFSTAAVLCAAAVIVGAGLQGEAGIRTLSGLSEQTVRTLVIATISAASTVTVMTVLRLPISTSQAMVGAIAGIGLATRTLDTGALGKVVICWVSTPIGAMIFSVVIYRLLRVVIRSIPMSILTRDRLLWIGLIVVGTYGSYALGANNVANATGIFSGLIPGLSDTRLALLGGASIALGVVTYSRRVMFSVGTRLMTLDAYTALVAVASMALTTHVFAVVGVPVSTSQAIIGAILGIGLVQRFPSFEFKVLRNFAAAWVLTPAVSLVLSAAGFAVFPAR